MKNSGLMIRVALMLLLTACFVVLAMFATNGRLTVFENAVYALLNSAATSTISSIMALLTNLGSVGVIAAVVLVLLLVPKTRKSFGFPAAVCSVLGALFTFALKNLFGRERPGVERLVDASGYSFPSGHTLSCTALCVIILLIVFRQTKDLRIRVPLTIALIVIPLLVGITRVYLGVHYAGDVLAGLAAGVVVALLVDTVLALGRRRHKGTRFPHPRLIPAAPSEQSPESLELFPPNLPLCK